MTTANDIAEALRFIPADDRDIWLRVGMAVKSAIGDRGFPLWDDWSSTADNYSETAARDVWRSIKAGPVQIGTLFHIARERGYRTSQKPPERPIIQKKSPVPPKQHSGIYAAEIWLKADCSDDAVTSHPYALAKGIESAGGAGRAIASGRVIGKDTDCIVIPIRNLRGNNVVAVQCVNTAGEKQTFGKLSDPDQHPRALLLGNTLNRHLNWFVAEGWASAYSIVFHHSKGNACCAAAFGKSQLKKVAHAIADVYRPERLVIIREQDG